MPTPDVFDDRICHLGEGALWHPRRQQLFWFDILERRLLSKTAGGEVLEWPFDELASTAGWVDLDTLIVASESGLSRFTIDTGKLERICATEADNSDTRSNDGRADPWGGFWFGTMGKRAEPGAGVIYRYYRGAVRQLHSRLTIPNSICFSPDRLHVYFSDTPQGIIWRQTLAETDGWPEGEPEVFIDCRKKGVNPDGAVVDAAGNLWNAQWGAGRVACYSPTGNLVRAINFPASQMTCPAFGGEDLSRLYVTSATENLSSEDLAHQPNAGKTFTAVMPVRGQPEPAVVL